MKLTSSILLFRDIFQMIYKMQLADKLIQGWCNIKCDIMETHNMETHNVVR